MSNKAQNVRLSNYEWLRIVSMVLIIMHHYAYHGEFEFWYYLSFNKVLVQFLALGGKLGVNCFVLLSGYFLSVKIGGIPWKNAVKFIVQVAVFSLAISVFGWTTGLARFTPDNLLTALFPLLSREWWFASVYFVLLLLSPFLNRFVQAIDQKTHLSCIAVLLFLWSFIPTLVGTPMESNDLSWFVTLYILAAYIRKYNSRFFTNQKGQAILLVFVTAWICVSVLIQDYACYQTKTNLLLYQIGYVAKMSNTLVMVQSVALFCVFHNLRMKPSRAVNFVASSMFGVYLIHDSNLLRPFLWQTLFQNQAYRFSPYLFAHAAAAIALVFVVCTGLSLVLSRIAAGLANGIYRAGQTLLKRRQTRPKSCPLTQLYQSLTE